MWGSVSCCWTSRCWCRWSGRWWIRRRSIGRRRCLGLLLLLYLQLRIRNIIVRNESYLLRMSEISRRTTGWSFCRSWWTLSMTCWTRRSGRWFHRRWVGSWFRSTMRFTDHIVDSEWWCDHFRWCAWTNQCFFEKRSSRRFFRRKFSGKLVLCFGRICCCWWCCYCCCWWWWGWWRSRPLSCW